MFDSSSSGRFTGMYKSTLIEVGCLFEYNTSANSTGWWTGVWGANTNELNTVCSYKGLYVKSVCSTLWYGLV